MQLLRTKFVPSCIFICVAEFSVQKTSSSFALLTISHQPWLRPRVPLFALNFFAKEEAAVEQPLCDSSILEVTSILWTKILLFVVVWANLMLEDI